VQCKGWGHPVTTGLPTMDYYLSSDLMEPPQADQYYSEDLVRLPNLALCYRKPHLPKPPKTRHELAIPSDRFVYLSTQSIFKYLPQNDDVFVQIARQVPEAIFVFISSQSSVATERFRHRLKTALKRYDLDVDHFCHFSPQLNFADFLSLNMAADVLLDTFDWSGGKTTLEALSCGVPVVTSPGGFMRGRHAYAMLKRIGLPETIGLDKAAYIRIAVRLAHDPSFYADVKTKLMAGCHKLYDDHDFIKELEIFYKSVVENHPQHAEERQGDIV
jgi:predicted O-linked N-acetylglucosamine transferase (SPINDLY family)